jgi:hypothetical protein
MEGLKQFPLTEGIKAVGMINVFEDQTSIVPENAALRVDSPTIAGFLIPKALNPLCTKNSFSYRIAQDTNGNLTYILIIGRLADTQIKELQTAARWAFSKAAEKTEKS